MNKTSIDRYPPGLSRGAVQGAFLFRRYVEHLQKIKITVKDCETYFYITVLKNNKVVSAFIAEDFSKLHANLIFFNIGYTAGQRSMLFAVCQEEAKNNDVPSR